LRHIAVARLQLGAFLLGTLIAIIATPLLAATHPGRGAMSPQDMVKMAAPADTGSSLADLVCARSIPGSTVTAPPELHSVNGVLEVTFKFLTTIDTQGLARYCYVTDTGLESPTLRVNPGDKLVIHLNNQLPATDASSMDSASGCGSGAMSAEATNIHFHGTNVAPVCGQDEVVTTLVQPGQTWDYNVQIPANEPPGLYWYHPHVHGFSEGQVQGGATGAIIVEGLQNVDPALANLPERTFVIRDLLLPASEANDPNIPAWDLSINYVPVLYPTYTPAVIEATPGEQELWRVANTSADTILNLKYLIADAAQPMQVVAIDGYPIAAGSSAQPSTTQTSILMPPGSRAEFVVTTPATGQQGQLATAYWNTGPDGDFDPTRTIATVVNGQSISAAVTRMPAKVQPSRVTRFAALATAAPVAQRNLYFSEVLENPSDPNSPTNFFITQQGQTPAVYTMGQPPNIIVHSGTVEDWVIENHATEDHIFHIHQIHFQVLEVNGQPVNDPAIRDTVDLPYWSGTGPYPSVKVRMDFRDPNIIGTFVYHCHILQHEDAGMMGEIQVLPAGSASAVTASVSATSITPNSMLTMSANVVDAATNLPLSTGTVQFELNGNSIGDPVAVTNGFATLTTTVNGAAGTGQLTAFYQGDSTYTESNSAAVPLTISNFALVSQGAIAPLGAAANAIVTVNVADGFTTPIQLSCTMPSTLTESACFVNPGSTTGSGQVSLVVNTTPAHPLNGRAAGWLPWFAASGGISLAGVLLVCFPRRAWRGRALLVIGIAATLLAASGCGAAARLDPGTPRGTYNVLVTATAGQFTATTNVAITVQ
jgi:FtsP/CotA-like multicopper oxidase with cupredoxin domain